MKKIKIVLLFVVVSNTLHAQNLTAFVENKLYGYKNEKGEVVIQPKFEFGYRFSEGLAVVDMIKMENGKKAVDPKTYENIKEHCVINTSGNLLFKIPTSFLKFHYSNHLYSGKRLVIYDSGKKGAIDEKGNVVIKPAYDLFEDFSGGAAAVVLNKQFGLIDIAGNPIIPFGKYHNIKTLNNFMFEVKNANNKTGAVNSKGMEIIPTEYDYISYMQYAGMRKISKNKKEGLIDSTGKLIIPVIYDAVGAAFSDELLSVKNGSNWGFVDRNGNIVIPFNYESVTGFTGGICIAKKNGKFGAINKKNKEVITISYDKIETGNESLFLVTLNGKKGFLDKSGKIAVPLQLEDAYPFYEGLAGAKKDNAWGFINIRGQWLIERTYDQVSNFIDGKAVVYLNNKRYVIDKNNNLVK